MMKDPKPIDIQIEDIGPAASESPQEARKGNNLRKKKTKQSETDKTTSNLNKLCKLTPEGFMITIRKESFER